MRLRNCVHWFLSTATILGAAKQSRSEEDTTSPTGAYAEELELVPDASVADSLARQKNLNFSSVRIDGEASDISLSSLTADQILNAVVTKVPTPDLDADAVGGLLQLTSRRAFDQKKRTLRGSVEVSYDPLADDPGTEASITFGRSFALERPFGFLATLEFKKSDDRDEEIELGWSPDAPRLDNFQVEEKQEKSFETNFNCSIDWKPGEESVLFLRSEAQFASGRECSRSLGFDIPPVPHSLPVAGADVRGTLKRSLEDGRERSNALTLAAGASHHGETWLLDLGLIHRAERDRVPDERDYDFEQDDAAFVYRHNEPGFPTATTSAGATPGDAMLQRLEELQVTREKDKSTDSVASADITRLWSQRAAPGWFKSGVKVRQRRTTRNERHDIYEPAGAGLRVGDVAAGPERDILSGRYALDGFPSFAALRTLFEEQPDRFSLNEDKTRSDTDPANFDVRQQILSAYAMTVFTAGGNRMVIGLRAERTTSRLNGSEVEFNEDGTYTGTRPVMARNEDTQIFPGIHLSRSLTRKITIYGSWTRSIRRPDYTDLVPARRINRADREIEEGNADLAATLYQNYDVAIDYAYSDDGQVSLELYHRDIRDPVLTRLSILTDGPFAGFERERPENGGKARLQGLQLTWQQELAALSDGLGGLEIEFNYTHERSRQSIDNRPGEWLALTERPTHEISVQLSYDRGPYYVSVEFERTGLSLDSIGRRSTEDRFIPAWSSWDVSISRKFGKGMRVFLEVENVTGTAERRFAGDPSRPDFLSLDLREYRLGMKWEL